MYGAPNVRQALGIITIMACGVCSPPSHVPPPPLFCFRSPQRLKAPVLRDPVRHDEYDQRTQAAQVPSPTLRAAQKRYVRMRIYPHLGGDGATVVVVVPVIVVMMI